MIGLVMISWNDDENMAKFLPSVEPILSHKTIVTDDWGDNITGKLNHALKLAKDTAPWLLKLDADMSVTYHKDFLDWLASDPDPTVDAWMVEHVENGMVFQLPVLLRGNLDWEFKGEVHEWLDMAGRKRRPMVGLTIHHHATGSNRAGRYERVLRAMEPNVGKETRDTFYVAEAYRCLGRIKEAIATYKLRASMGGWDEEVWYSKYQAAKLANDIVGLLNCYGDRPWRHEPLTAAAAVAKTLKNTDVLFLEK